MHISPAFTLHPSRSHGKKRWLGEISPEPRLMMELEKGAFFQPTISKNWIGGCLSNTNTAAWERSDDPCGEVGFHIYLYLLSLAGCWWARPTPSPGSPAWRGRARCTSAPPRRPAAVNSYPSIPKVRKKLENSSWVGVEGWKGAC